MSRITCRTPSTGRPLNIILANVPTTFTTVAEAPDFSVPDASEILPNRDPSDPTRAIRSGEIFLLTPLAATNKSLTDLWIEVQLLTETGDAISFGKIVVPAGDTTYIPTQGRSIFKRIPSGSVGDRLQVRAQSANSFDIWASAEERPSSEHSGVIE